MRVANASGNAATLGLFSVKKERDRRLTCPDHHSMIHSDMSGPAIARAWAGARVGWCGTEGR